MGNTKNPNLVSTFGLNKKHIKTKNHG